MNDFNIISHKGNKTRFLESWPRSSSLSIDFNIQHLSFLLRDISLLISNTPLKLQVHKDLLVIKSTRPFYILINVADDTLVHSLIERHLPLASMFHIFLFPPVILAAQLGIHHRYLFFCPSVKSCRSSCSVSGPFTYSNYNS